MVFLVDASRWEGHVPTYRIMEGASSGETEIVNSDIEFRSSRKIMLLF